MGTRLDRLVALVDGGSTPALRKQAASQLGGIAAQHGEESFRLLGRVAPLLRDKRQDARVAGSWAVEAVVANAPAWPPRSSGGPSASHSASSAMDIDQKSPVEVDNVKIEDDPLAYLSASSLLSQPHLLAASAASFIAAIGSAPSLKEQKAAVDKELGIEHSGVEVVGDTDLVDPNMPSQDAKAATAKAPAGAGPGMTIETKGPLKLKLKIGAQSAAAPAPAQQSPAVPDAAPQTPSEGLSYRQQLMAKKKAKMEVTKLGLPPPRLVSRFTSRLFRDSEHADPKCRPNPIARPEHLLLCRLHQLRSWLFHLLFHRTLLTLQLALRILSYLF